MTLLAAVLVAAGCGETAQQNVRAGMAHEGCIDFAQDRAEARVVMRAYSSGELGSAQAVRRQIARLAPLPGSGKASFLRPDGTMVLWASMSDAQQRTFMAWLNGPAWSLHDIGAMASEAARRAADAARSRCAQ